MPTSGESWWCENITLGPWPFALMLLPLVGAYLYGRQKQKLGWMVIGAWAAIQIPLSYVNYVVVRCPADPAALQQEMDQETQGATQPPQ
ncbi:MAG TPA: hypothetical protein VK446_14595 [Methylocystis sp.]|nr:hypothetical protein [Methylocystis sp.]